MNDKITNSDMSSSTGNKKTPPPFQGQYQYTTKKFNWWIIPIVIVVLLVIVGFFGLMIFQGISSSFSDVFKSQDVSVKNQTVLLLDIESLSEIDGGDFFSMISGNSAGYFDVINAIENAANDDKIEGLYYKAGYGFQGFAKAEGLQRAIKKFKESGKFVYAYLPYTTETQYYNAMIADSIFMPGEAMLEINGFATSGMFYPGFFDKVGVKYNVVHFEDFKSYGESYDKLKYSDSSRYNLQMLLNSRRDMFIDALTEYRGIDKEKGLALLESGAYCFDDAYNAGLVDVRATESEVKDFLKKKIGAKKLRLLSVKKYASSAPTTKNPSDVIDDNINIAIVNAEGAIVTGDATPGPFGGGQGKIFADKLVKILMKVRDDDEIDAVILRINSPGGSVLASEEIYDAVLSLKAAKPVFASMGDVAASGGYFIAMPCNKIFAEKSTVTGSIGVVSAIPNVSGTLKKLGITTDEVKTNDGASFMNDLIFAENTDAVIKRFTEMTEKTYHRFIQRVADNRNMTFEKAHSYAKGRVWTGAQALERGLIDGIAGEKEVLGMMKEELGIDKNTKVNVTQYPSARDELESLLSMFGIDDIDEDKESIKILSDKIYEQKIMAASLAMNMQPNEFLQIYNAMPEELKVNVDYLLQLMQISQHERYMYAMPNIPYIR